MNLQQVREFSRGFFGINLFRDLIDARSKSSSTRFLMLVGGMLVILVDLFVIVWVTVHDKAIPGGVEALSGLLLGTLILNKAYQKKQETAEKISNGAPKSPPETGVTV